MTPLSAILLFIVAFYTVSIIYLLLEFRNAPPGDEDD